MTKSNMPQNLFDGFLYSDADRVVSKLQSFATAGSDSLHVVSDFDLTLTAGKMPGQNLGTWDVMDELMPAEGVERHRKIYESFRPIELQGRLTNEVAIEKWAETLDLITGYHMNIDDIEKAFLAVATLREGAKDLFAACESQVIPTVILSSGIKNVIELMVGHYDIRPDYILSNTLTVDGNSRVSGWNRDTLIHMLNKNEMGHSELSKLRSSRRHVLLLGDVPDDTKMVLGEDVIRIRVLDPRKGESNDDIESMLRASYSAGYDLVVEHSLQPVVRIVNWLSEC